jgi:hypothetical protein
MVGLTLFAELAAAVACGGLALSLAALSGAGNRLRVAEVGAVIGFFIGFVSQLGLPILALPTAVIAVSVMDRWIDSRSTPQVSPNLAMAQGHPKR